MPSNRRGNFWLLLGVSTLCGLFPISLGIYAARLKARWLWILFASSIVIFVVLFVGFATSPTVPDPDASSGTRTDPNALASVAILGYVGFWITAVVVQFVKRADYEASYVREGKTLDLSTIRARQFDETSADPLLATSTSTQTGVPSQTESRPKAKKANSNLDSGLGQSAQQPESVRGVAINTVNAEELQALGISKGVALAVIARRDEIGGYTSAVQIQSSVEMPPHEWVKLRSLIAPEAVEVSSTDSERPDDRPDQGPRPGGRILDV